ncbi:DUF2637 domain-containing protein [Streptomyces sp. NPDC048623]|uniref:DUF2637 domain-containing protein n=1 Tax=Streptomyces sp. NPDC048623 TaxID=3155761 RepID=UPI003418F09C
MDGQHDTTPAHEHPIGGAPTDEAAPQPAGTTDETTREEGPRPLWKRPGDWDLVTPTAALGTYGLIALGFSTSYEAIRQIARDKGGFGHAMSNVVPLSFEGGIIVLSLYAIKKAREGKRATLLELLIAVGSLATLYVNWNVETDGITGKLTHVIPVAMFLICFKYLVHATRTKALEKAGVLPKPLPRLRLVEWALAPRDSFAQWRYMAIGGIRTQEHAMWVHHQMELRKVELLAEKKVSRWSKVPLHERLRLRNDVLAKGEQLFGGGVGRYSTLASHTVTQVPAPAPAQAAEPLAIPAQTEQPELENPQTQTALPPGVTAEALPADQADHPLTTWWQGGDEYAPDLTASPEVETQGEREQRERLEEERVEREKSRQRQSTYEKAIEVALELVAQGQPVTGGKIADDERVPVGARSVERYLRRAREEGKLPADV